MSDVIVRRPSGRRNTVRWPLNRLFDDFFGVSDDRVPELWTEERFIPAINVSENENSLTLTAEVPGIAREDLNVTVEDGVLVLRGEKKEETKSEEAGWHRVERRYGHFERRVRLPEYVDAEQIDGECKNGVLTLRMAKVEKAKPHSIKIK